MLSLLHDLFSIDPEVTGWMLVGALVIKVIHIIILAVGSGTITAFIYKKVSERRRAKENHHDH